MVVVEEEGEEKVEELKTTTIDSAEEEKKQATKDAETALTAAKAFIETAGKPETLKSTVETKAALDKAHKLLEEAKAKFDFAEDATKADEIGELSKSIQEARVKVEEEEKKQAKKDAETALTAAKASIETAGKPETLKSTVETKTALDEARTKLDEAKAKFESAEEASGKVDEIGRLLETVEKAEQIRAELEEKCNVEGEVLTRVLFPETLNTRIRLCKDGETYEGE